jgi:hypothetical protein
VAALDGSGIVASSAVPTDKAAGKTSMEAMRCAKRRLSDVVYRELLADAIRPSGTGPGGHMGATTNSSAADSNPDVDASEKSCPGPVNTDATPTNPGRLARSSTLPDALKQARPATVVKRTLLDHGEDRRPSTGGNNTLVDTEGSQMIPIAETVSAPGRRPSARSRGPVTLKDVYQTRMMTGEHLHILHLHNFSRCQPLLPVSVQPELLDESTLW